jgi:hypothetical protein
LRVCLRAPSARALLCRCFVGCDAARAGRVNPRTRCRGTPLRRRSSACASPRARRRTLQRAPVRRRRPRRPLQRPPPPPLQRTWARRLVRA